jgi:DNA-binding NtrC family response regulator
MVAAVKHILVVADNDDVRDVIVDTLREYRYRVSAASDGSAMRDCLQTGDTVDCVILDALMPGEVSLSLVLHLKECHIPVIIISGSPDLMGTMQTLASSSSENPFDYESSTVLLSLRSAPAN